MHKHIECECGAILHAVSATEHEEVVWQVYLCFADPMKHQTVTHSMSFLERLVTVTAVT